MDFPGVNLEFPPTEEVGCGNLYHRKKSGNEVPNQNQRYEVRMDFTGYECLNGIHRLQRRRDLEITPTEDKLEE